MVLYPLRPVHLFRDSSAVWHWPQGAFLKYRSEVYILQAVDFELE